MVANEEEVGGGEEALTEQVIQLSLCVEGVFAGEANHTRVAGNPSIRASAVALFALVLHFQDDIYNERTRLGSLLR